MSINLVHKFRSVHAMCYGDDVYITMDHGPTYQGYAFDDWFVSYNEINKVLLLYFEQ